jgi:hypothetical protein
LGKGHEKLHFFKEKKFKAHDISSSLLNWSAHSQLSVFRNNTLSCLAQDKSLENVKYFLGLLYLWTREWPWTAVATHVEDECPVRNLSLRIMNDSEE